MNAAEDNVLPNIFFQSSRLRLKIILSYWAVFLFGIPLWWMTTSIERLALPVDRVRSSASANELRFPLDILIESKQRDTPVPHSNLPELVRQVGALLEEKRRKDPVAWQGLDVRLQAPGRTQGRKPMYEVELHSTSASSPKEQPDLWLTGRSLNARVDPSNYNPSTLANALSGLLVSQSSQRGSRASQEHLVARYAPRYRLAFSLLNEDAAAGGAVHEWEVEAGIRRYLSPVLTQLNVLHNFTIESQVQFHAPLAFEPPSSPSIEEQFYLLGEEELKMFINSAEWTLASSVSEDPVLHFILFVPSSLRRPLRIQSPTGATSNAFIVPQWGGVVILDEPILYSEGSPTSQDGIHLSGTDLASSFQTFRSQLLTLLGVSPLPRSISPSSTTPSPRQHQLSDWQLDALLRRRALENTRDSTEALSSIVKLVDQIENMPVGQDVRGDVQGALDAIAQVYSSAADSPYKTLEHSARANTLSSRAFFNPGMLALLYFPAEHKYAVYIPLFAPIMVPLVAAAVRELRRWREERRTARREKEE